MKRPLIAGGGEIHLTEIFYPTFKSQKPGRPSSPYVGPAMSLMKLVAAELVSVTREVRLPFSSCFSSLESRNP
jgi:hypothetical protein